MTDPGHTARVPTRRAEILYVEDSAADDELLRSVLAEFPALSVRTVFDGEQALACLRAAAPAHPAPLPDLILLDLDVPRLDGRDVLAELKSDPALRSIPVIVLSDSTRQDDLARAYELGANAYVVKPGRLDEYRATVRAICEFWCGAAASLTRPLSEGAVSDAGAAVRRA